MQAGIRHTCLLAAVAFGLVVATAAATLAQPGSSNLGTWKLNLAKSTFAPGTAPTSAIFTNVVAGAGIKSTSDSVAADGTARHSEYSMVYDGKDTPLAGNSLSGDTVAGTRVDANTVTFVYKKGGKTTITTTNVASSDRKTYTITAKGTNTLGQAVNSVAVYDKQPPSR
jgi:hypothetical protein